MFNDFLTKSYELFDSEVLEAFAGQPDSKVNNLGTCDKESSLIGVRTSPFIFDKKLSKGLRSFLDQEELVFYY